MRLDHLLSKEHLRTERCAGARGPRVSDRGARRRRHWPVRTGNGSSREYSRHRRHGNAVKDAAGCLAYKLAPCWVSEGTTVVRETPRLVFNARHDLDSHTGCDDGAGGFLIGLWVGRWLRIAQWTRASCFLWLSCQGRTVDALAPGADEGRGRPR